MGHTLMENRNGLIVNAMVTQADGHAEREAAKAMVADARQIMPEGEITVGADKGYDAAEFIKALQDMKVTPHVAQNKSNRKSAVPEEIASTESYGISMQKRKLIEQGFGWAKFIGPIRQVMVRGIKKEEGRPSLHDGHGRLQPRAHAHLGVNPSGGPLKSVKRPEMPLKQLETSLKWGDATSEATRTVEKQSFTSAAGLRALGISAACRPS